VEEELTRRLADLPGAVGEAMRYAALGGGKRLRGTLLLTLVAAHGRAVRPYLPFAAGIECIHAYSLVHDDLPAMDDDELRRGRPTCHRVFGEAQAILAGDGLLTEGLALLLDPEVVAAAGAAAAVAAFRAVAAGVGPRGMVLGQSLDMTPGPLDLATVEAIHAGKTAAFFRAVGEAAAHLAGGDVEGLGSLGAALGHAFQIQDDLLDVLGTTEALGKTAGKDRKQAKRTYVAAVGVDRARAALERQRTRALALAAELPRPDEVQALIAAALPPLPPG
jgi:geranylgeranyl pyrophosphate synthase